LRVCEQSIENWEIRGLVPKPENLQKLYQFLSDLEAHANHHPAAKTR